MTLGQAIGGAAGAIGGAFLGNPILGFQIGMGIGSFIDPPSAEEPNQTLQTQDLQFNVFTRNLPVPIVYGTCRVAGNILWIGNTFTEIVERESTEGGKGAPDPPKTREVWYHADFSMALSEGEIAGVSQVKVDDEDFTDTEGLNYTIYDGDAAQGPDPLVVGALGASAPAFRNTAHLLFTGRLGRANRIPNVTAIVQGMVLTGETFTDTFSRSNAGSLGPNWAEHGALSGAWSVASNQARTESIPLPNWARIGVVASAFAPAKNMRVSLVPMLETLSGTVPGVVGVEARVQSLTQEAYALIAIPGVAGNRDQQYLHLVRFTAANSYVFLAGSVAAPFRPGNVLTLVVSESLVSAEVNGYPVIPPKSDGTIRDAGFAGMIAQTGTRYLDTFMAGVVGNPKEYPVTFSDDFNRANATDLGCRWMPHQSPVLSNEWEIQGSVAFISQGFLGREWLVPGVVNIDPDMTASVRLVDLSAYGGFPGSGHLTGRGVEIRAQNSSQAAYIGVINRVNSGGLAVQSTGHYVAIGMATAAVSFTVLKSAFLQPQAVASGDRFGLTGIGPTLSLFISSTSVLQVADSTIQSAGTAGLFFNAEGSQGDPARLDDFQAHANGNLGRTGAETSVFATGNPAIEVKDLLTKKRYGLGLPISRIERVSFEESAAHCDELIPGPDGTLEKRFVLDIVLDQGRPVLDHLRDMLSTFRGFLVWAGGTVKIRIERAEEVSQSFDMGSIVADSFQWRKQSYRDRANVVRVEYINASDDHRHDFVEAFDDWDIDATGERRERTLRLQGIKRPSQAQRMATFYLDQSIHCANACSFRVGIAALKSEVGDVIEVSHDVPGWVAKKFRILQIEEAEDDELTLTCLEYNAAIYHDRANAVQPSLAQPLNAAALPYHVGRFTTYKRRNEDIIEAAFTRLQSADQFAGALMYRRRGTGGDFVQLDGTALALAPTAYLDSQIQTMTQQASGTPSGAFADLFNRSNAGTPGPHWQEILQTEWEIHSLTLRRGIPGSGGPGGDALVLTSGHAHAGDGIAEAVMFDSSGHLLQPRVGVVGRHQSLNAGSFSGQAYVFEYTAKTQSHAILEVGLYRVTSGPVWSVLSKVSVASGTYWTTPGSPTTFRMDLKSFGIAGLLNGTSVVAAVDSWIQGTGEGGLARRGAPESYPGGLLVVGPNAYWRLGDSSGTAASKEEQGRVPGSYFNAPTLGVSGAIAGDGDTAVSFVGSSHQRTAPSSWLTIGSKDFSMETWLAYTVTSFGAAWSIRRDISADNPSVQGLISVNIFTALFSPGIGSGWIAWGTWASASRDTILRHSSWTADGSYHHVAGVYKVASNYGELWVDGTLVDSRTQFTSSPVDIKSAFSSMVGANIFEVNTAGQFYSGKADEVALYPFALSSAAIVDRYRLGIGHRDAKERYAEQVLADLPRGYWRLGDAPGATIAQEEMRSIPGSYFSGVTRGVAGAVVGDHDTAARFDGTSGFMRTDPNSFITVGSQDFSMEAVLAFSQSSFGAVVALRQASAPSNDGIQGIFSVNRSEGDGKAWWESWAWQDGNTRLRSTNSLSDGKYHHLVTVYRVASNYAELFVDGSQVDSRVQAPGSISVRSAFAMSLGGNIAFSQFADCKLDEVAVYPFALSSARIVERYRSLIGSRQASTLRGERWDSFIWGTAVEVNSPILVRGLVEGWGARVFDPSSVLLGGAVASGGTAAVSLSVPGGSQPTSGFLQVFQDQSFTAPALAGRFPSSGFADFRGGDAYLYDRDLGFVTAIQTFLPIYNAKGGFANIGSVRLRAEEMGYSTFTDSRLEGVTRGAAGTPATSHSNLLSLGAFVVTTGAVGSQSLLDLTAAAANPLSNMPFFADNSTYVYLGGPSRFSRMGMFLERNASSVVSMGYEYSTGAGAWASLVLSGFIGPTDLTSGLTQTGPIFIEPPGDWSPTNQVASGGATIGDASSRYYLRMLRTSSLLATPPRELEILLDGDLVVAGRKENAYLYAPVVQDSMQALFFKAIAVGVVGQMAEGTKAPTSHVWSG